MEIKKLPLEFISKGWEFKQLFETEDGYLYERKDATSDYKCYEVFEKKLVHQYDFENKVSLEDMKEKYPGDEDFGAWAWNPSDIVVAKVRLFNIPKLIEERKLKQNKV